MIALLWAHVLAWSSGAPLDAGMAPAPSLSMEDQEVIRRLELLEDLAASKELELLEELSKER